MFEHPHSRSNITLDEFIYCHGLRSIIRGLLLERAIYESQMDSESVAEIDRELDEVKSELFMFVQAMKRSNHYHQNRIK